MLFYSLEAGFEFLNKDFQIRKGEKLVDVTMKDAGFILGEVGADRISETLEKFSVRDPDGDSDKKK